MRSAASAWSEWRTPAYVLAVIAIVLCPRIAETVLRSTPLASSSVAQPWRRS